MVAGAPKRDIHPLTSATDMELAVMFCNGIASTQRVNLLMNVSKYRKLLEIGRDPTMSMCM